MKPRTRKYLNYFIDMLMGIAFVLVCMTGIIKYPPFQRMVGMDITRIRYDAITVIHDLSGIAVVALGLLHLVLHLKWLKNVTQQLFRSQRSSTRITVFTVLAILGITLVISFFIIFTPVDEQSKLSPSTPSPTDMPSPSPTATSTSTTSPEQLPTKTPAQQAPSGRGRHGEQSNIPEGLDLSKHTYLDGSYTGESIGYRQGLRVEVTITDGQVSAIEVIEHYESPGYFEWIFENLPPAIIEHQSTQFDAVAGATKTFNGYLAAVEDALSKAEK